MKKLFTTCLLLATAGLSGCIYTATTAVLESEYSGEGVHEGNGVYRLYEAQKPDEEIAIFDMNGGTINKVNNITIGDGFFYRNIPKSIKLLPAKYEINLSKTISSKRIGDQIHTKYIAGTFSLTLQAGYYYRFEYITLGNRYITYIVDQEGTKFPALKVRTRSQKE